MRGHFVLPCKAGELAAKLTEGGFSAAFAPSAPTTPTRRNAAEDKRPISWLEIALGVVILLALLLSGGAQAQTCPPGPTSTLTHVDYNPLSSTDTTKNFVMTIQGRSGSSQGQTRVLTIIKQREGEENENVRYRFSPQSGGNLTHFGAGTDDFEVLGGSWRGTTPKAYLGSIGSLAQDEAGTSHFSILIPKNQSLPATSNTGLTVNYLGLGRYDELQNTGACLLGSGSYSASEQSFILNVASAMAISLVGGGTSGTIDFGNALATNATRSVNLRLRSNVAYKVTMDSTHNGVLKLNNLPAATEQIAYTTTLDGTPISETTQFVKNDPSGTGGADVTLPFEVKIGDTSAARAGFYKDIITLTIGSPP